METKITTEELSGIAKMAKVEISQDVLSGIGRKYMDETDRFINFCRNRIAKKKTDTVKVVRKWDMLMQIISNSFVEVF
jgi:hypothetical protein